MEVPPNCAWARRPEAGDLVVATSPDFAAHHNTRASAEWDASSPCADDMQTDSPSSMKTPVPEGRHGMEMDSSPMPMLRAPRSPWKKPRRGSEADLRFDDEYDADLIWTSGENFKFEQTGSDRCDSPTILSGEGLSLGMLDLSGTSDPHFGSDCGPEERLDDSSIHAMQNSANTSAQCAEHNTSQLSASPTPAGQSRKAKMLGLPSPGRVLDNSGHSAGNSSLNHSQMQTAVAVRDVRPLFNVAELNESGSPLHPQKLFGTGMVGAAEGGDPLPTTQPLANSVQNGQGPGATPGHPPPGNAHGFPCKGKGAMDEAGDVLSSLDRPARRLSAPLTYGMHSSNPSPGRLRYNPFLSRTGAASSGLKMGFFGEASAPLTTRSFMDDFCEQKEIGRGSFGRVFSCRRKIDLCLYAVKEINNEFRSERERERLLREIYALSTQGDNVHVVRYFNAWEQDDKLYIQTELCTGSLKDVRKQHGSLPEDAPPLNAATSGPTHSLKDILVQVAAGLTFMHTHKMAHLDVKPDNIYTTERGIYKLGDLGLASRDSPRTHEDEGDKRYLSRELLQQHDNCDLFKADVFALGVTLLEMATGTPAPAEGNAYHGLREGRIDMPNHLSPEFKELLRMLLHSEAAWRPSAREIVRHPLLCGLMRDESIACLRTQPRCPPQVQRTSATLMESEHSPELMVSVHNRALKAEKEVSRLRAALQTAQQDAALWRERAKVLEKRGPARPNAPVHGSTGTGLAHANPGVCSGKDIASPQ